MWEMLCERPVLASFMLLARSACPSSRSTSSEIETRQRKRRQLKKGIKNVNALHERKMKLLGCGRFCGKDLYLHHLCRLVILLVLLLPEAHHMKSKQAKGKEKKKDAHKN